MHKERVKFLMDAYIKGICTPDEEEEFFSMLSHPVDKLLLEETLLNYIKVAESTSSINEQKQVVVLDSILKSSRPTVHSWLRGRRIGYAAVLLMIIGAVLASWYVGVFDRSKDGTTSPNLVEVKDIAPGRERATLTLADGSTVLLDNASNGVVSQQSGVKLVKLDSGTLAYSNEVKNESPSIHKMLYNTIAIPRGGQYQLVLPDGTRVWLNAESTLTFPVHFSGNNRTVQLTGEAYFKIASNKLKPFFVQMGDVRVEVLGTSFNVNAYTDEGVIKTTLIEGAVKVKMDNLVQTIAPGQQAVANSRKASLKLVKQVEVDHVVAWKEGAFFFNATPIEAGMRQIGRWYDVEIVYEGKMPTLSFNGMLSRKHSLAKVLKVLELSGMKFRMEGKRLIVLP